MRHQPRSVARLLALVVGLALVATACGTSTPALSDPKEILVKAVESLQKAKSFHLALTLDGEISLDLMGTGSTSPMTFAGTKIEGDVDISNQAAALELAVPALFGLTGEIIVVDGDAYVKTSLTGAKYQKSDAGDAVPDPSASDGSMAGLREFLDKPEIAPVKGTDTKCNDTDCYSVTIELTAEELAALGADVPDAIPSLPLEAGTITLTILVEKASLRPASISAEIDLGEGGSLTLVVAMSKWDAAVSISAPPADQVEEGGSLFP
jgi:hypothetical protein